MNVLRIRPLARLATPLLALALLVPAGAAHAQDASPAPSPAAEAPSLLFVMSAPSGAVDTETITLRGAPSLIWLTDRPYRDGGQVLPAQLATVWQGIVESFDGVAPNAVLSVFAGSTARNAVVKLIGVDALTVADDGATVDIAFRYTLLDGDLPTGEVGTLTLFIDNVKAGGINQGVNAIIVA